MFVYVKSDHGFILMLFEATQKAAEDDGFPSAAREERQT